MKRIADAFQTLSRLLAAVSLFFIAYDVLAFGLTPVFAGFMQFWEVYVRATLFRISKLIGITISDLVADCFLIYVSFGFCNIRRYAMKSIIKGLRVSRENGGHPEELGLVAKFLINIAIFLLWPLVTIFNIIYPFILRREGVLIREQLGHRYFGCYIHNIIVFGEEIAIMISAFILIFLINYAYL